MKSFRKGFINLNVAKVLFVIIIIFFIASCVKIPTVSTGELTNIKATSATGGGNVTDDGGATVTSRGVCWKTTPNPTMEDSKTTDGSGNGIYISNLEGLLANTIYYVRAYATNRKGKSYGTQVSFKTDPSSVTDIDGNVYKTVTIGTQVWIAENLKTTRYNDGSVIPFVTGISYGRTLSTPGYCWYDYDSVSYKDYGHLYNWYTVSTEKICPIGWHVPANDEWTALTTYLGGDSVAGGKLKETEYFHWVAPNWGATNETGFTALAGGWCKDGKFGYLGYTANFWSASEDGAENAWDREMCYETSAVRIYGMWEAHKWYFYSVRCLRDD
jgi:uncharacterized protein (TIGR02145 family)